MLIKIKKKKWMQKELSTSVLLLIICRRIKFSIDIITNMNNTPLRERNLVSYLLLQEFLLFSFFVNVPLQIIDLTVRIFQLC